MQAETAKALQQMALALLEAIEAIGKQGVPSGHLYARVMPFMSLDVYQCLMAGLEQAGKVRVAHHVITATKYAK